MIMTMMMTMMLEDCDDGSVAIGIVTMATTMKVTWHDRDDDSDSDNESNMIMMWALTMMMTSRPHDNINNAYQQC